jgi:hypothetical protein
MREKLQELRHIAYRLKAKLLHESAFGRAIRGISWKAATEADGLETVYFHQVDVFRAHTMNHIRDEQAIRILTMEVQAWSSQRDAIYLAQGDVTIEPENSLAFLPQRKFIVPTRSNAHEYLRPPLLKALLHRAFGKAYTHYEALVHFDGFVGRNLFHFFDESLNAYLLLRDKGNIDGDIPFLINERVYKLPYVQYVIGLPELKGIRWAVQKEGEWIRTNRLYKAMPSYRYWESCYALMGKYVRKEPHRKIFLNRKRYFQRRLTNNEAIETILKAHGFETVYAEDLSYAEQVQLFAETRYFVGLHGAGLTNLIFSDLGVVHVLEIFSESLMNPHFYWFLELLKVNYYDAIVGSAFDVNWNYSIDETRFGKQLQTMMQQAD